MLKSDAYHPFATPCFDLSRYFVSPPPKKATGLNLLSIIYRTFEKKTIIANICFEDAEKAQLGN